MNQRVANDCFNVTKICSVTLFKCFLFIMNSCIIIADLLVRYFFQSSNTIILEQENGTALLKCIYERSLAAPTGSI